jgi:2,5-diketo-D-gluconate reductase A
MMSTTQETTIPTVTLNNGVRIPQLGFGVFQVPPEDTQRIVEDTLEAGYRHIDTAAAYRNEAGVHDSREAIGVDYIDLYLIHWPVPSQGPFTEAWTQMEKLYASGEIRAIGVSNFLPDHLDTLLSASDVVPAVNQIEIHPTFQQRDLAVKNRSLGIAVEAYSPLGQGADLGAATVKSLAARYGATPAQIVLAWHLSQGTIAIPKSADTARMRENLAAAALSLTPADIAEIAALESGARAGADPAVAAFSQL